MQLLSPKRFFFDCSGKFSILARDSIRLCLARYMLSSVRPSVHPSHGWISQKRLKLGS